MEEPILEENYKLFFFKQIKIKKIEMKVKSIQG